MYVAAALALLGCTAAHSGDNVDAVGGAPLDASMGFMSTTDAAGSTPTPRLYFEDHCTLLARCGELRNGWVSWADRDRVVKPCVEELAALIPYRDSERYAEFRDRARNCESGSADACEYAECFEHM